MRFKELIIKIAINVENQIIITIKQYYILRCLVLCQAS